MFNNLFNSSHHLNIINKKRDFTTSPVYYSPKYVYVPITFNSKTLKNLLPLKSKVKKGTVIGYTNDLFPIYSPVCGTIEEKISMHTSNFTKEKMYKIKNSFKGDHEINHKKIVLDDLEKGDILNLIRDSGVFNYDKENNPAYYSFTSNTKIETILINAVETTPFITSDNVYSLTKLDYLLYAIPYIRKLTSCNNIILCINAERKDLLSLIEEKKEKNKISTLDVKLIDSFYPNEYDKNLVKIVLNENFTYTPLEKHILILNIYTIEMIGKYLLEGKRGEQRCYSLYGEINSPCNVVSPFGVLASDLINDVAKGLNKKDNLVYYESNPLSGFSYGHLDYVLLPTSKGICISQKNLKHTMQCIRCGKCIDVCPANLYPDKILVALKQKDYNFLHKLRVNRCINCGLCSYVCPSNLALARDIYIAQELIKEVDYEAN